MEQIQPISTSNTPSKSGLTGSTIKYIGIALMVFDHLNQMFNAQGIPSWFHWLGRPVLPIFLFMCAEAVWYTRNRLKYLLRLFIGFEVMNIIRLILITWMPLENIHPDNNVFQTLMFAAFYMMCIEMLRAGIREKKGQKTAGAIGLMLLPLFMTAVMIFLPVPPNMRQLIYPFIPSVLATEGGFFAVIMGILFFLFRKNRLIQILVIVAFSAVAFILRLQSGDLFGGGAQWLEILAIIPLLLYNSQRGKGNTYFFYVFYPAHIFIFYIIAWFLH